MMSGAMGYIGFPPPLLGERALRLPVLHCADGLLALDKPAGVSAAPHPWYLEMPQLDAAIMQQIEAGKPELVRLGLGAVSAVFHCEPYYSGVMLFATNQAATEFYRNQYGSAQMQMRLLFVCRPGEGEPERLCDLPLANHRNAQLQRMVVSHTTGKKASTRFRLVETFGTFALWEATLSYHRMHQVLLHAFESGLPVVGDAIYAQEPEMMLSRIKRGYRSNRGDELPIYDGPAMRLQALSLVLESGESLVLDAGEDKRFEALLKRLRTFDR